jgi:hypothetical protein
MKITWQIVAVIFGLLITANVLLIFATDSKAIAPVVNTILMGVVTLLAKQTDSENDKLQERVDLLETELEGYRKGNTARLPLSEAKGLETLP